MIVLDTSGLLAALDPSEAWHDRARVTLQRDPGPFVLSPFVLAELDYLLATRIGLIEELALLHEVKRGAYELAAFDREDVGEARRVVERYRDLEVGLADASIVVLAAKRRTNRILTLDERHFRAMRPTTGRAFTVLPADA